MRRLTTDTVIDRFIQHHGDKYDYTKVNYVNAKTKVTIICPEHGEFQQTYDNHVRGTGCPICGGSNPHTKESFIGKSIVVHGDKYNYEKVKYVNNVTPIEIRCAVHGTFIQTPKDHLAGCGCPKCGKINISTKKVMSNDEFVLKATQIHGNKYDYSLCEYDSSRNKITIICPTHGKFIQRANAHLNSQGCPTCKESSGERKIRLFLETNEIDFEPQKRFDNCRLIRPLPFDFYVPKYNLCIEYDGEQHFRLRENNLFDESLEDRQNKDTIKTKYCNGNDGRPTLLRVAYYDFDNIEKLLSENIPNISQFSSQV